MCSTYPVTIIETSSLDKETFNEVTSSRREPIIFRGLDIGECRYKWTAEYLSQRLGDIEVKIHVCPTAQLDFINKNFIYRSLRFKDYIQRVSREAGSALTEYFISADEHYYLRSLGDDVRKDVSDVHKQYPSIADDITIPSVFDQDQFFSSVFRIASPCCQLWTHYDVMDNLLIQVVGKKKITLFPPSDLPFLYMHGDKSMVLHPENPDLEQFPLFSKSTAYAETLLPGDVIFIPALWFHNVAALDFSVAVNVFWKNLDAKFYDNKDVYGNKDLVPAVRAQQGVTRALKAMDSLPPDYKQFYTRQLISMLQKSLVS